jgi:hypothetical protein
VRAVLYVTAGKSDERIYGLPVCVFRLSGRQPDPHLSRLQAERYLSWLRLRDTLRGSGARKEDRLKAFQLSLPVFNDWMNYEPLLPDAIPGIRRGPPELEKRLQMEINRTATPENAYSYWTNIVLRLTALTEWKCEPAVLCFGHRRSVGAPQAPISSLEVAHYAWAIVGGAQAVCLKCGETFLRRRKDNQYCSSRCKFAKRKANQRARQAGLHT